MKDDVSIPCFYCDAPTLADTKVKGFRPRTIDHVIPKSYVRSMDQKRRAGFPHISNRVVACEPCNRYKGILLPLDWLVIMPSASGAKRVAELLVALGCRQALIDDALSRRKRMVKG